MSKLPPPDRSAVKAPPRKPGEETLPNELERLSRLYRPEGVPLEATFLCAWVELPTDNQQRNAGSTKLKNYWMNQQWKVPLEKGFRDSLNCQFHPGVLEKPRLHILSLVAGKGDATNATGRHKYVIDVLQTPRMRSDGRNSGGTLSLFADDGVLNSASCTIEERATRVREDRKVMLWVWGDDDAEQTG